MVQPSQPNLVHAQSTEEVWGSSVRAPQSMAEHEEGSASVPTEQLQLIEGGVGDVDVAGGENDDVVVVVDDDDDDVDGVDSDDNVDVVDDLAVVVVAVVAGELTVVVVVVVVVDDLVVVDAVDVEVVLDSSWQEDGLPCMLSERRAGRRDHTQGGTSTMLFC